MGRSGYNDNGDMSESAFNLYRGTVDRSIAGKRGQVFLKRLRDVLNAMPIKRLIQGRFQRDGEHCAIGALLASNGINQPDWDTDDEDEQIRYEVSKKCNISSAMAAEILFINDDDWIRDETPEHRWARVMDWVKEKQKT